MELREALEELIEIARKQNTYGPNCQGCGCTTCNGSGYIN